MIKTLTESGALFELHHVECRSGVKIARVIIRRREPTINSMYRKPRERRTFRDRCNEFLKRRGLSKTESMPRQRMIMDDP
jgi:hypothetical protein